ncbi:hemin-degrading factor [Gloeobacter morelensis]|uniref:Heme utilization protein HuvX n=1 Tax=Gloeobacter morelensis MG652769 TaxID=2781736 RepID=A0ABY3PS37_9CYAN|nr:hemin-degrading factor [Gloeobacter morelensis]UFP96432.1 heme utilization protein HuvX [Gloeobacter morelensis MG652769]
MVSTLKEFLDECGALGLLRFIVTNDTAVLEARGELKNPFYVPHLPHYANLHSEHFEFHLNMAEVKLVRFEELPAKRGNFTTYAVRFLKEDGHKAPMSLFLQWGQPGEYAPGQVEAFQALKNKYGESWVPEPVAAPAAAPA